MTSSGIGPLPDGSCPHCGLHGHIGMCPRIRAVEYNEDGTVRRIEYHATQPAVIEPHALPPGAPGSFAFRHWKIVR